MKKIINLTIKIICFSMLLTSAVILFFGAELMYYQVTYFEKYMESNGCDFSDQVIDDLFISNRQNYYDNYIYNYENQKL